MGQFGSFYLMSPEALARFQAREFLLDDHQGERFSIDKLWYAFHVGFKQFGPPLSMAVNGDHQPFDCPPDIDSFVDGRFPSDFYIATVSPPLVREIHEKLTKLSEAQIEMVLAESQVSPREYFTSNFKSLRDAYESAAQKGFGLQVVVC